MAFERRFPFLAPFLGIFFFIATSIAEKAPYTSFAKDATSAAAAAGYYDYIIIGGGTAGCALAATLSTSAEVLLLERGGLPYDNPNITHISGLIPTLFDTSPSSAAQVFESTDGVILHRGRILGGGSAINMGFYSRASRDEVEEAGWDPKLVNESYSWVERKLTSRRKVLREWQTAVRDGLLEAGVVPYRGGSYEHLVGTKIGNSIFDENGYRHSSADLLEYGDEAKITLYFNALVHQILFTSMSPPKARGVFFRDSKGRGHTAFLNGGPENEIILSAGAMGSPQLLMLSGIGPAGHLKAHGIEVILDQQMVGQAISDNPLNGVLIPTARQVESSVADVVGITDSGNYIESGSGLFLVPKAVETLTRFGFEVSEDTNKVQGGFIVSKVNKIFSRGNLELKSKDQKDNPKVTFNYFKDQRDLQRCVHGMETVKKVVESEAFSRIGSFSSFESLMNIVLEIPMNTRPKRQNNSMEEYCIDTVTTMWHYHGGCQVGRVVDGDYRVIGVDGLRVVDGSTFSSSPGTNPQATVMMLGRYVGQKILEQRALELGEKSKLQLGISTCSLDMVSFPTQIITPMWN